VVCSSSLFQFSSFSILLSSQPLGSFFFQVFGFLFFSLLTSLSTLIKNGMQAGWVRFSTWKRDVCAAAMAVIRSGRRSRLQLPPCFRSQLLPSSSFLTQHSWRFACSWSVSVFFLEERIVSNRVAAGSWGDKGSPSLSPLHLYPPLNKVGVFGCCPTYHCFSLSYPKTGLVPWILFRISWPRTKFCQVL